MFCFFVRACVHFMWSTSCMFFTQQGRRRGCSSQLSSEIIQIEKNKYNNNENKWRRERRSESEYDNFSEEFLLILSTFSIDRHPPRDLTLQIVSRFFFSLSLRFSFYSDFISGSKLTLRVHSVRIGYPLISLSVKMWALRFGNVRYAVVVCLIELNPPCEILCKFTSNVFTYNWTLSNVVLRRRRSLSHTHTLGRKIKRRIKAHAFI